MHWLYILHSREKIFKRKNKMRQEKHLVWQLINHNHRLQTFASKYRLFQQNTDQILGNFSKSILQTQVKYRPTWQHYVYMLSFRSLFPAKNHCNKTYMHAHQIQQTFRYGETLVGHKPKPSGLILRWKKAPLSFHGW